MNKAQKKFNSAVILVGGKSTRMGFDKKLLEVNGTRLVERIAAVLKEEFEEIIFVSNSPTTKVLSGYRVVSDEIPGMGPLSGIHAGLLHASSNYVYFLACDMPHINLEYIRFMKDKIKDMNVDACITKLGDWIEPFNAFYSSRIINEIETDLHHGSGSIFKLLKRVNSHYIEEETARKFSPDWGMFLNLNTSEDLTKYLNSLNYEMKIKKF